MYAVVEWVDENPRQVSVVPLTWIIEGNGEALCYWPPECIAKKLKRKDFETQRLPAPVEDWSRHRVRCLRIEGRLTCTFFAQFLCQAICTQRTPKGLEGNRRLYEHGIYIRHCQESNPQPVPSQVRADSTMPQ